jgi:hypothetical protein
LEDVDIAIINNTCKSGNEIKTIIHTIEKEITADLTELQMDGITSKGCLVSVLFLLSMPLALTYILWKIFIL